MIGPISPDVKQMGARSAGNPHAACDVEGAGNVARSGCLGQLARQSSTLPGKPFFVPSPAIRFAERAEGVKPDLDSRTGFRHREWQKCWRSIKPGQKCGAKL